MYDESVIRLGKDTPSFVRKELTKRMTRTPDMNDLILEGNQLVFVYGTLKQGFHNHGVIDRHADYLGKGRTLHDGYQMYDTGGFPVVMASGSARGDYVYGEVYSVEPQNMIGLDRLEANGAMYERLKVKFKLLDQNEDNNGFTTNLIREAWMYVGMDQYWEHRTSLTRINSRCPMNPKNNSYLSTGLFYQRF